MFSFFSSLRVKVPVKKAGLLVLTLVLSAAVLGGCKHEPDEDPFQGTIDLDLFGKLAGEWKADDIYTSLGRTIYTIDEGTLEYDDGEGEYSFMSFSGAIKHVVGLEGEASGVIIVQYTTPPLSGYQYLNGYNAVYFKGDPDTGLLYFANAYTTADYTIPSDTATLQQAVNRFTGNNYADKYINDPEGAYFTGEYFIGEQYQQQ